MKKITLLFCLFIVSLAKSQAPQYLNYQAIARDASGNIISTAIGVKFEILQGSASGTLIYEETNTIIPSSAGIFTTAIGGGTPVSGTFSTINWANSPYFLRVSIDPTGGTSYSAVGTSQLLSVPYALYAEKAGNSTAFTAGSGINISSGVISNASPNQTVNISGPNVIGTYPNYTVTSAGAPTASTGISIVGGTITNTAPDQTVTLAPAGISSITGTYPSFTIDVPPPSLNYNTGTNVLTLTQGTAVATTTLVGAGSNTVSMFAQGIANVNPVGAGSSFTVSVQSPTFTPSGPTTITGTYPNFTINSPAASTVTASNLQINVPHSTSTISANNYSINIVPTSITGPGVLGSYPNYTVTAAPVTTVIAGTNVTVGGTGPTYTVNAVPTLSLAGNNLSISGGNSVTLPAAPSITITGTGIAAVSPSVSTIFNVNVPPPSFTSVGSTTVSGSYPNYTVTSPGASPSTSITSGSPNVIVSGSAPSYTISAITPPLSLSGTTLTSGVPTNSVNLSSLSVWSSSVGVLYPTTLTNSIAIGSPTASAALDVIGNSTGTIGRFINTTNTGGTALTADFAGGSSAATYIGIKGNASAIGGNTYGLYGSAGGAGTAIGVYGSMNGAGGYGVYGIAPAGGNGVGVAGISTAGSTTGAFGVFGSSQNSWGGVFQNSGGTIIAQLGGQSYPGIFSGGNVGINVPSPGYRLTVNETSATVPAIYGTQTSASSSSSAHGIQGLTSNANPLAAGIYGDNTGTGPAVFGNKTTSTGPAGRFELQLTSNNADAIFANTNGGGAALHAINGPTVAGGTNIGVWLDAGHLKSTSPTAPATNTISTSGGGINGVTLNLSAGSTDVKGVMNAVITTTGIVNSGNNCVIRVTFNKSYTVPPVVIVTPITDLSGLSFFVNGITTTSFNLTIRNSSGTNLSTPGSLPASFNYIVIE
jgi:hypothetical protein